MKNEARDELYQWFDKEIHPLPKKADGSIDPMGIGLVDNDVDAMRHAYVSGVYVMEFSEETSEMMGRINELSNTDYSSSAEGAENMDFWNNDIGRKYGKQAKTRRELFELLIKALKNSELIITPDDTRKYNGRKLLRRLPKSFVIKIKENMTGANIEFLDVRNKIVMKKEEFILAIKRGKYPGYGVRKHKSGEYPYSIRDRFKFNNLG
ncbi:MAG: hypothetical protein H6621_08290 [Halobacteriovoraceae bacterium]|nr:hypothetical protein [Halobacteriovoraceae bacterium]